MSWAYGVTETGEEIGYGVAAVCAENDCGARIDKGLAYRCGGSANLFDGEHGCGKYFCYSHLTGASLCFSCEDLIEDPYEDAID